MGKRSTNTTKSGKFMNPTDQARKEARKRELKKNKRQRQMVRTAVLKGKNPRDIIMELEKIDDMEFNVLAPPPLNEKVLRDKRRKLIETWNRVMHLYEREDPEQFVELRKLWYSYQTRKNEILQNYEAVMNAQNVQVDDIPLPSIADDDDDDDGEMGSIPLPPGLHPPPKTTGILKKPASVLDGPKTKICPGVPAGPPPSLSDYDEDQDTKQRVENITSTSKMRKIRFAGYDEVSSDDKKGAGTGDDDAEQQVESKPKVDPLQKRMLAMSGQDVDAYMKEMEAVHRQTQAEKERDLQNRLTRLESSQPQPPGVGSSTVVPPGPPPGPPPIPGVPPRLPIMFRPAPPPLRPGIAPPGVRLPPGPPPGRPPIRLPPGPPPGVPPPRLGMPPSAMRMPPMPRPLQVPTVGGGVVSAGPQLIHKEASGTMSTTVTGGGTVMIEGKPQMRNLLSDVTRFVPTNVKVKQKGDSDKSGNLSSSFVISKKKQVSDPLRDVFSKHSRPQAPPKSKDDAYAQFMREMEQIMK